MGEATERLAGEAKEKGAKREQRIAREKGGEATEKRELEKRYFFFLGDF